MPIECNFRNHLKRERNSIRQGFGVFLENLAKDLTGQITELAGCLSVEQRARMRRSVCFETAQSQATLEAACWRISLAVAMASRILAITSAARDRLASSTALTSRSSV